MVSHLVRQLAEFAADLDVAAPERVLATARDHVLDTVGVALAAHREDAVTAARSVMESMGGAAEATVWGTDVPLPAASAAMINGTMAHALDFDDTHLPSVLHPSASVVPAALAVAEAAAASGADLIQAVVAGIEITCRLGLAAFDPTIGNSVFFERGLHATSICGTIGSAATTALLLGGGVEPTMHAMSIGASMGAGLLEANRTGGTVKRTHCGWAAHAGVTAGLLAAAGLTGPSTVLEGRFGFFEAFTGGYCDQDALVGDLGDRWEVDRLFVKPYPTNHFTHAGIDAALALRSQGVNPTTVAAIELGVPEPVLRTIAEPREEKVRPASGYHATFSGPFTVAAAFHGGGGLGVAREDFSDEMAADPDRLELASRVTVHEDQEATAVFPFQFPAVLRVRLEDGTVLEHRVRHTRGGPENPLTDEELVHKFHLNADPVIGIERAGAVVGAISHLQDLDRAAEVTAAMI